MCKLHGNLKYVYPRFLYITIPLPHFASMRKIHNPLKHVIHFSALIWRNLHTRIIKSQRMHFILGKKLLAIPELLRLSTIWVGPYISGSQKNLIDSVRSISHTCTLLMQIVKTSEFLPLGFVLASLQEPVWDPLRSIESGLQTSAPIPG